jgi:hypothetical protein
MCGSIYAFSGIKMDTKVGSKKFESKVETILTEAKMPVSAAYVAERLKVGWGTARAILLDMTVKGRVRMILTNIAPVFCLGEKKNESKDVGQNEASCNS